MPYNEKDKYNYRVGDWKVGFNRSSVGIPIFHVFNVNNCEDIEARSFASACAIVNCLFEHAGP